MNIEKLTRKYSELFKKGLDCYKYSKATFEVNDNVHPIFIKPRIPLAYQEEVESEIDRLVKEGVLEQIETADWGTPIVPVPKNNSEKIRVCAEYKVTINRFLKHVKCFVPNIDDIFASLSGVAYFSKLDLRDACKWVETYLTRTITT